MAMVSQVTPRSSLPDRLEALAGLSGVGILGLNGSTVTGLTLVGTANQIDVANGTGPSDPTISIASNPTLPGTGAVLMPGGTTAERPGGTAGQVRFNSDSGFMEYYTGSMWANLSAGASIANNIGGGLANQILVQNGPSSTTFITAPTVANTFLEWSGSVFQWSANPLGTVTSIDVSGGTTGLTYSGGPITSAGTITMAGTLITTNGGTGLSSYTAGDITYYATGTAFTKLAIGASTFILTSTGTAPQWSDPAGISVNTATNVAGGGANQIVFNTASGTTSFITAPTVASTYLEWSGSAFQWSANPLGTVTSVDVSGGTTGLTTSGGPITTSGTITLAGTLAVANGGTNQTSYTDGELLIGNSTGNTLTKATLTAGTGVSITNGTGSITIAATNNGTVTSVDVSGGTTGLTTSGGPVTSSGTITIAGTLITSNGGTGLNSYTAGDLVYYATGTTFSKLAIGSSTFILTSTGTAPQWSDPSGITVGTATNATNADNVAVAATSTNATYYPTFVDATTGDNAIEVDTDLTYNPSTNTLTVPNLVATSGISGGTF
jgi:hypothetical protein